jgi:hypothetical protein
MATVTPIEGCFQNEVRSSLGSVGSQNVGDFDALSRLSGTHVAREAFGQNTGLVFHSSLGTAGQLDVIQDAAINEHEESLSFNGEIPEGGQRCRLSN